MADTPTMVMREPDTAADDERVLLARHARGDAAAFAELVAHHAPRVTGLAWRLLGWRADVDDVVQDVFTVALRKLGGFRGDARLATWLYRITVNCCRRHRRRQRWRLLRPDAAAASTPASDASLAQRERHARVRDAVDRLPPRDKEAVVLRYLEELPLDEIAVVLGRRRNAVEVQLSRARARLKVALADLIEA